MEDSDLKGIKIVMTGGVAGCTRIFTQDGRDITSDLRVRSIQINHSAGGVPTATLECLSPMIDVSCLDDVYMKKVLVDPPGRPEGESKTA